MCSIETAAQHSRAARDLRRAPEPCTPQEQEMVKREIEATDNAIDRLVYELFGLTPDEINIVEGKS